MGITIIIIDICTEAEEEQKKFTCIRSYYFCYKLEFSHSRVRGECPCRVPSPRALLKYYSHVTYVNLRCRMWWFNIYIINDYHDKVG